MADTCSQLATMLDAEMIGHPLIFPRRTEWDSMPVVSNLPDQLGGRYLLRYVHSDDVGKYAGGAAWPQFATPTPYAPSETVPYLALPRPTDRRMYVLLLDPAKLRNVKGPRWIAMGQGIEYLMQDGFRADAMVSLTTGAPASWELEVR